MEARSCWDFSKNVQVFVVQMLFNIILWVKNSGYDGSLQCLLLLRFVDHKKLALCILLALRVACCRRSKG